MPATHPTHPSTSLPPFIASIDTMKESMDTINNQLTDAQIAADVNLVASLNTTHITVNTFWDYPDYMLRWVNSIRRTGKHVWFRTHPLAWEGVNGVAATLTPSAYLAKEYDFIVSHASFFQPGDIADMCPEAENSPYWINTYGDEWTDDAPNEATDAFNKFLVGVTNTADAAFQKIGTQGVTTTILATNAYFPLHPDVMYPSTVARLGHVTIDTEPDSDLLTNNPIAAMKVRTNELVSIWHKRHIPIIMGEFGWNIKRQVSDADQNAVIKAETDAVKPLSYIVGANYWIGAGNSQIDPSRIFAGSTGDWWPRPAALTLAAFYACKTGNGN